MKPQISQTIQLDILADMPAAYAEDVLKYLRGELFGMFAKRQADRIRIDIGNLDPNLFEKPDDFYNLARDMRLLLRFWSDLLGLSEENSRALAAQQTEE